jgi:hypothetical protein
LRFLITTLLLLPLSCLNAAALSSEPNILLILTDDKGLGTRPEAAPALVRAAKAVGLTPKAGHLETPGAAVMIIESRAGMEISDEQAERLGEFVRAGGGVLLSVRTKPGRMPMRLAFMLPTTAWMVSAANSNRDGAALAEADPAFFSGDVRGLRVPFFFEFRPFHAVERGQARYDRFERPLPSEPWGLGLKAPYLPPDSEWWTRPLLNRDWQIRARADDLAASPLLLTGRYGAGRVAVFASSVETLPDSAAAEAFWKATLEWLRPADQTPAVDSVKLPAPTITGDAMKHNALVTLRNPGSTPLAVQLVARLMTWEHAPIGDELRELKLPAGGSEIVEIPLPKPGATSYAALEDRDAFRIRLGVLSADGSTLLSETRSDLDLRPAAQLTIATEEVRSVNSPFPDAPEPSRPMRMGLPVASYAWRPGQTVNASVTLTNGLRNLAPFAAVEDETTPGNKTLIAINDEAAVGERRPVLSEPTGWGFYEGRPNGDNVVRFTLPEPATLAAIVLLGAGDEYRNQHWFSPGSVIVEVDGKEVARAGDLAARFLADRGKVRVPFAPVGGKIVRLTFAGVRAGSTLRLGDVFIEGTTGTPADPVSGRLSVVLHDALSDVTQPVTSTDISAEPLGRVEVPISLALPTGKCADFYRLEATFTPKVGAAVIGSAPILAVQPARTLIAISKLKPTDAAQVGLIVTRGFREFFDNAVGTAEIIEGWAQPDDLVWAYASGMKQLSSTARTRADRLYVSESDMRHYSTPWRQFGNGEEFYEVATPGLVERMKRDPKWKNSDVVVLGHSDRWDTGPEVGAMHSWQDYEGFSAWLRARGLPGLTGRTQRELAEEINQKFQGPWEAWHQERYTRSVGTLREAFAREGKRLVITAQGVALIPTPADAAVIGEVVRGMSDDHTWGMLEENLPFTTGRQMGAVAFNPSLAMSTLNMWGYVSTALNNPQWHAPVSTTEPSRRVLYDRAFRGMILPDGSYGSMHTYGYNENAGHAFTLNEHDYNAWNRVQEKHSLLTPDGPLGAGLVISTAHLQSLENRRFTCGMGSELPEPPAVARALQRLQEAGVSISFSANAASLEKWTGSAPLVLLNVEDFSDAEMAALKKLSARGVKLAAFCGAEKVPPAVAAFFGVNADGLPPKDAKVSSIAGKPIVSEDGKMFVRFSAAQLTAADAREIARLLREQLEIPITFPAGTTGYGFVSNGRSFIVVEDWLEQGRTVLLRVRAKAGAKELRAADANDHRGLITKRDGADWTIELPLRPGDAALVAFEEL